jgi:hypothetical protein
MHTSETARWHVDRRAHLQNLPFELQMPGPWPRTHAPAAEHGTAARNRAVWQVLQVARPLWSWLPGTRRPNCQKSATALSNSPFADSWPTVASVARLLDQRSAIRLLEGHGSQRGKAGGRRATGMLRVRPNA